MNKSKTLVRFYRQTRASDGTILPKDMLYGYFSVDDKDIGLGQLIDCLNREEILLLINRLFLKAGELRNES